MLQNQSAFSLAGLLDSGARSLGDNSDLGGTFLGNLFLGNDVMGVASIFLNYDLDLATLVSQSASRGLIGGIGEPPRIGGNQAPAVQPLFPRRGRPAQALRRSKNLSSALGLAVDILDFKDTVDLALTAGLAFACR
jgi:hypothetical protein